MGKIDQKYSPLVLFWKFVKLREYLSQKSQNWPPPNIQQLLKHKWGFQQLLKHKWGFLWQGVDSINCSTDKVWFNIVANPDKMSRLKFFIFLASKVSGNTFLNNAPAVLAKGSIDSNLQFMVNGGIAERPSLATVMLKNTYP